MQEMEVLINIRQDLWLGFFYQQEGINYEDTFVPIVGYTTIQSLVCLATSMGWNIHQMDVKTTFLNVTIDE